MPPFWCLFTMRQRVTVCAFSGLAGSEYLKGDNYHTGKKTNLYLAFMIMCVHVWVCMCVCVCDRDKEEETEERVLALQPRVSNLGGVYVVLQGVDEEVSHRLPGVSHPLRLLQGHSQLLHRCLDLE